MSIYVLKNCRLLVDEYDLSGDMNTMELDYTSTILDSTTFTSDSRTKVSGIKSGSMHHRGYYQANSTLVDDVLAPTIGNAARNIVTIFPEAYTLGNRGISFESVSGAYQIGAAHGELMSIDITAESHKDLVIGTCEVNGAKTTSSTSTGSERGALSASQKLWAAMHIVDYSGTLPTFDMVIQSDDTADFLSPTDRITFTQASGKTAEIKSVSGAVTDTFWRASWTIGGTETPTFNVILNLGIV